MLGAWSDKLHTYLEQKYNDGKNYVLHYVTAREAYNIAKAAEAGKTGSPNDYRDFVVRPYVNRFFTASRPFETISFSPFQPVVRFLKAKAGDRVKVHLHFKNVRVTGDAGIASTEMKKDETVLELILKGDGVVGFAGDRLVLRSN